MTTEQIKHIVELSEEREHLQSNIEAWTSSPINLGEEDHIHIEVKIPNNLSSILSSLFGNNDRIRSEFTFCTNGKYAIDIVELLLTDMKRRLNQIDKELDRL